MHGPSVCALALRVDDARRTLARAAAIADSVAALVAQGTALLPIPANYYDDLAARLDLDAAALAALQARNLLYDRDEAGDFTHAYTDSFHDRFFFEVVQRHGYQGFGAVNAAVRMAAQAQRRAGSGAARLALL